MEKKIYTIDDFKDLCYGTTPIEEYGGINHDGKICMNYSNSLSALIREAGRWCERYASDLFIDYECILNDLKSEPKPASYLFGFRQHGVDHDKFILSCYNNRCITNNPHEYYRAIWRLDIAIHDTDVKFTTYRVEIPYL